jgi:phage shock protein PspC (stress-responsive transcriptional regulator)
MSIWDERADLDDLDERRPQLVRSRTDRVVWGVCGGIGHATGVDPLILRLGAIVLTIVGVGWTIPAYLIAAVVMRKSPDEWARTGRRARRATKVTVGWALVSVGAFALLQRLHWIDAGLVAAVVLIVLGINLVLRHRH